MSNLGITLSVISIIFMLGALVLHKNTPKPNKHH
jgi:hypothetical protein